MYRYIARSILAGMLLALLPTLPGAQSVGASSCTQVRNVGSLALAPGGTLLAGTNAGAVYRLRGNCWSALTPLPGGPQVGTLLVVPGRHSTLLAGGSWLTSGVVRKDSRLYLSEDAGLSWTAATTGLPKTLILPVRIAPAPSGALVMAYVCPTDHMQSATRTPHCPRGLARSVDGGRSWRPVGPSMTEARGVTALANGSLLAAALSPAAKYGIFYTSTDDGRTWHVTGAAPKGLGGMAQLYAVPWEARGVIGVGDVQLFQPIRFHSIDGGAHWVFLTSAALRHATEISLMAVTGLPRSHTLLFGAFGLKADLEGIYRSDATGTTTQVHFGRQGHARIWALLTGADGATAYAATPEGVYRSIDDGRTWQQVGG